MEGQLGFQFQEKCCPVELCGEPLTHPPFCKEHWGMVPHLAQRALRYARIYKKELYEYRLEYVTRLVLKQVNK